MTTKTFYWHDYETFGIDPQRDSACQFAGIRTDLDFNIIGEPLMAYCKVADDYLPSPDACLITGITPQLANEKGICEAEFTSIIYAQLAQAGTCGLGYNTIRFDDEVTRNLLYRNFYDPYGREWQNGNSRWDMIDVVRAAHALRPDGINWPKNQDGVTSFRLEALTEANNISHQAAHDALSDVYATIALARLVKQKQPKLYTYLFENRYKQTALKLLQLGSFSPVVHISGRISTQKNCLAIVLPICLHPKNSNEVIVFDLSADPQALFDLDAEAIQKRVFVANDELPEGIDRIPLKTVHINKSPVLTPLSVIRETDARRLQLDLSQCQANLEKIKVTSKDNLQQKLADVFTRHFADSPTDPDLMIYSGGFFSQRDKAIMERIRQTSPHELARFEAKFDDVRLPEMLRRYLARNYPETLSTDAHQAWETFCRSRLLDEHNPGNLNAFFDKLEKLEQAEPTKRSLLAELRTYGLEKQRFLQQVTL